LLNYKHREIIVIMDLITQKALTKIIECTKQENHYSSWVEIDKKALNHNIEQYKKIIGSAALSVVVKSNAYGHGIEQIAKLCEHNSAVHTICTVSLSEALALRSQGIKKPILVLSIINASLDKAVEQSIDLVLYNMQTALELNTIGQQCKRKVAIHIKIDTGLSRLGFLADNAIKFIKQIHQLPFIYIKGIFTHFSESESADQAFTHLQQARFNLLLQELEAEGVTIPLRHSSCSAATTATLQSHHTMVRIGIGLYGLWPSEDNKKITQERYPDFSLQPVLSWKTKIIQIKEIPAESYVGYDRTYVTTKQTRIATISIGYWDGYDRQLSNKGAVIINNQRAYIVGRIAMNIAMIDVTDLDVSLNDEVMLMGNHEGVRADDIAQMCSTINYEVVTRINPLLPRIVSE
jgi:alanine racemase